MPESPWHLVRKGKYIEAEKSLLRLMADHEKPHARSVVAIMIHTNNIEQDLTEGTSYLDYFKGDNLRRTEIGCLSFLGQITCGIQFAFSTMYFFQQAGVSSSASYKLNLRGTAISFLGTILS
jgi:SP family general alpha glucoside:H+ symporter-like MFS transporter